jgi:hypothetical protein
MGDVVKRWLGLFLFVFVFGPGHPHTMWAQAENAAQAPADKPNQNAAQAPADKPKRLQPGAQASPTDENQSTPKFSMDYFVGEWKFEGNLSESPLSSGDPVVGSERIRNVSDGRFWEVTVRSDAADHPIIGNGIITYQDGFFGQFFTRYEVTSGVALLKSGSVGCDLGGVCFMYFETPLFDHEGTMVQLKGSYLMTSPYSYRLRTEISVGQGPYRNLGSVWYTKVEQPESPESTKY